MKFSRFLFVVVAALALACVAARENPDLVQFYQSYINVGDSASIKFGSDSDIQVDFDGTDTLDIAGNVYATGTIIGDRKIVTNAATAVTLTAAQSGSVIHDTTSTTSTITLPSAAAGLDYTVLNVSGTTHVDPGSGDQILRLTNAAGDKISTASAGASIRLIAADATNWFAIGDVDATEWVDGN